MIAVFRTVVQFLTGITLRVLHRLWQWLAIYGKLLGVIAAMLLMLSTLAVLAFWWGSFRSLLAGLPQSQRLERLEISPGPGEVVLGTNELWQIEGPAAAEADHVALAYSDGGWRIANRASVRKLELTYGSISFGPQQKPVEGWGEILADRWLIENKDKIEWPGGLIEFTAVGPRQLTFRIVQGQSTREVSLALASGSFGLTLHAGLKVERVAGATRTTIPEKPWCGGNLRANATLLSEPLVWIRHQFVKLRRPIVLGLDRKVEQPVLVVGGRLDCVDETEAARLSAGDTEDILSIAYKRGRFILSRIGTTQLLAQRASPAAAKRVRLRDQFWPLAADNLGALTNIVAGRTRYAVSLEPGNLLVLTPRRNVFWFDAQPPSTIPDTPKIRPEIASRVRASGASAHPGGIPQQVNGILRRGNWMLAAWVAGAGLAMGLMLWLLGRLTGAGTGAVLLPVAAACCTGFLLGLDNRMSAASLATVSVILSMAFATIAVWWSAKRSWELALLWLCITAIVALGNITLAQLGFGSDNTRWVGFFDVMLAPTAAFATAIATVAAIPLRAWRQIIAMLIWFFWPMFLLLVGGMSILLLLWLAFGNEEGLWGLQPSEALKTITAIIAAIAVAEIFRIQREPDVLMSIGRLLALVFCLAFVLLFFAAVPIAQSDQSPVLIMMLTTIGGAIVAALFAVMSRVLAWVASSRTAPLKFDVRGTNRGFRLRQPVWLKFRQLPRLLALVGYLLVARWITLLAGVGVAVFAIWLYVDHVHPIVSEPAAQYKALTDKEASQGVEKYERRILSYLDTRFDKAADTLDGPRVEYPDLAHQLIKSREAIAVGPCRSPGDPPNAAPTQIDRLAAYTRQLVGILRLGTIDCMQPVSGGEARATDAKWGENNEEAMAIPVVQFDFTAAFLISRFGVELAFLVVLLQIIVLAMMVDGAWRAFRWRDGDVADRFTRQVLCYATLGGALLLASQWTIAWGNVLGLLPIMGQPMTWISSSGSHVIMVAVPITAAVVVTFRVAAEGMLIGSRRGPPEPTFWQSLNYFLNRQRRR